MCDMSEIIQAAVTEPIAKRKPKAAMKALDAGPTMLDQFVKANPKTEDTPADTMDGQDDIVMNEDGTMYIADTHDYE